MIYQLLYLTPYQLSYLRSWYRIKDSTASARDPNDGDHHEHTPGIRQHDSYLNSMSSPSYLSWLLYYLNYKLNSNWFSHFHRHLEYLNHFLLKPK